jgi:hypothetical protein
MSEPRSWLSVFISAGYSALPVIGGPAQTIFDALDERSRRNAEQAALEFSRAVDPDTVARRLDENPDLEAVLAQAISAATYTGLAAKRKLLARAAAAAFGDDDRVEPATLTVLALAELEPVHIRALAKLVDAAGRLNRSEIPWDKGDPMEHPDSPTGIFRQLAAPIRAVLIRTGTIEGQYGNPITQVTDFGTRLIQELMSVADEDNERLFLERSR